MPIYEYECLSCGTTFETRQSFSDDSLADCPNGHQETRRLLSTPAIVFKGSGFYINDSKSKKKSANGSSSKSENSETKSDTKPESKTETKADTKSEPKSKSKSSTSEKNSD